MKPSECVYSKSGNTNSITQNLDTDDAFNRSSNISSHDEYHRFVNNLPEIVFQPQYLDTITILRVNHLIYDILGYTPESVTDN